MKLYNATLTFKTEIIAESPEDLQIIVDSMVSSLYNTNLSFPNQIVSIENYSIIEENVNQNFIG